MFVIDRSPFSPKSARDTIPDKVILLIHVGTDAQYIYLNTILYPMVFTELTLIMALHADWNSLHFNWG